MSGFSGLHRLGWIALLLPVAALAQAVPKASCRSSDKVETGLQGETTQAEVNSGANKSAVTCNADLVGQVQGEGASWQLAAWKNCAYYDQANNSTKPVQPGTVVVDVSDPAHPIITDHLADASGAMIDPWESLKVNAKRQLLGGAQQPGPGFAIYDISGDCRHPVLKSSVVLSGSKGHAGQWAPDGNTYYVTTITNAPSVVAVDTTDTSNPKVLYTWTPPSGTNPIFHDLEFSKDGNTAYMTVIGGFAGQAAGTNGLLSLDVSDIQSRKANPTIRVISNTTWDDGSLIAQNALPVTIAGKPYILFTDEVGPQILGASTAAQYCAAGKSVNGFPRLIDISDPAKPVVVSKIQIEMQDVAHCSQVLAGIPTTGKTPFGAGNPIFGHSCHYCNVDDADDATMAACSCFSAGMRFFDIRDPLKPKEVAYYKPPAQGTKTLPGSQYWTFGGAGFDHPVDWAPAKPSFPKDRGMTSGDVWFTTQDNGFQVAKLSVNLRTHGGCSSIDGLGATALLGLLTFLRRRRRASVG